MTKLKYPLKHLYGSVLSAPPEQMDRLGSFFQQTLSVRHADWRDMIHELEALKARNCDDFDSIWTIYKHLNDLGSVAFREGLRCVCTISLLPPSPLTQH